MREICSNYLVNHPVTLGGPGVVVQINETVMSKRKHSRDHFVPENWLFGSMRTGIDQSESNTWIKPMGKQDSQ